MFWLERSTDEDLLLAVPLTIDNRVLLPLMGALLGAGTLRGVGVGLVGVGRWDLQKNIFECFCTYYYLL